MLDITSLFLKFLFIHKSLYFSVSLPTKKILEEQIGHAQFSSSHFGSWQSFKEHALFLYAIRCTMLPQLGKANPIWGIDMRRPTYPQVLVTFSNICFLSNENGFVDLYILLIAIFSQWFRTWGIKRECDILDPFTTKWKDFLILLLFTHWFCQFFHLFIHSIYIYWGPLWSGNIG